MKKISFKKKISLFLVAILLAQSLANLPCSFFNMPIVVYAADAPTISWMGTASSKANYTGEVLDPAADFVKDTNYEVTSVDADPTVTFEYFTDSSFSAKTSITDSSGAVSEGGAPKNVGTYYIKATVTATNGTASTIGAYTFEIEKATPTITLKSEKKTVTYDGINTFSITADDFTVTGAVHDDNYTPPVVSFDYYSDEECTEANKITDNLPTAKGTYYVKASVEADGNYAAASAKIEVKIVSGKPGSSIVLKSGVATSKEYDALPFEFSKADFNITGTTKEPEFIYYVKKGNTRERLSSAPKDVGEYYCIAFADEDDENDATGELEVEFKITEATPNITWNSTKINRYYSNSLLKITSSFYTITGAEEDKSFSNDLFEDVKFTYYKDEDGTIQTTTSDGAKSVGETPKNAGKYYIKASITPKDSTKNYTGAETRPLIEYEIVSNKATASWKITNATKKFDGTDAYPSDIKIENVSKSGDGAVSFKAYSDEECANEVEHPINAGKYYIVAEVAKSDNSDPAFTKPLVYTITKADQTITWKITKKTHEYNNSDPKYKLDTDYMLAGVANDSNYSGNAKDVTFSYYTNRNLKTQLSSPPSKVGTCYVVASIAESENYEEARTIPLEVEITKATVNFAWSDNPEDYVAFYTGKPIDSKKLHMAKLTNNTGDEFSGDITYSFYKNENDTSPLPNLAAKGNYYVEAKVTVDTDNYEISNPSEITGKKQFTVREELLSMLISNKTVEYTGNPVKTNQAKVCGEDGEIKDSLLGNLSLNYAYYEDENCTKLLSGYPTDKGEYYVQVSLPESEYYTVAPITGKIVIKKATTNINISNPLSVVKIENENDFIDKSELSFTNNDGEKISKVGRSFYFCNYNPSVNNEIGEKVNLPLKEEGEYRVKITVNPTSNYSDGEQIIKLIITNKEATITPKETNYTKVYDGKPISLSRDDFNITPSSLNDVSFKYYTDSSLTNELKQAPSDVGEYYIVATVAGDGTYAKNSTDKFKYTITKSPTTISLKEDAVTVKKHDGTKLSISSNDFDIIGSKGYITIEYFTDDKATNEISAPSEIGNYYVKVSVAADENYEAASDIFGFNIIGTDSEISFKEQTKSKTYDEKVIALSKSDLTIAGSSGEVEFLYYKDAECTEKLDSAPKNAGTYYILAKVASDSTYNEATTREPLVYTIKKAPSTISIESAQYECDDTKHTVKAAIVTGSSGKVTYNYYKDIDCKKRVSTTGCQGEGIFYVIAKVAADTNYEAATSNKATLINVRYDSQISIQSKTVTYNGKKQKVDKALVAGSEGTIRYYYYTDSACKNLISKSGVKDAGTYYVKAVVAAKGKYRKATSTAVIFVIEQKSQTCNIVASNQTVKLSVIKKKKKTFKVSAKATTEVEFSLSSSNSSYFSIDSKTRTITIKKGTPKGIYKLTVEAVAKENNNYKKASSKKTIKIVVK
ncbi:hypothetical protein SAMN05216249_11728 [Acetitomaculum ruminis DSM 5522]|uniref:MBG domain-containing protein n=1 Tax=Acetitomaculum ruminis DSM 5522 TaxID=1120918 RepID=A0A1I0ZWH7_9FIRM|nr:hypothetical protein SAMN05216249_11728 [Acetitomaculum ruminis DSM 5522]